MKRKFLIIFILAGAFTLGLNMIVFADQVTYANKDHGYTFAYPGDWYFHETSERVDVFLKEDSYTDSAPGAGASVEVRWLEMSDEGSAKYAFERISGEFGEGIEFRDAPARLIDGESWYAVAFTDQKNNNEGECYVRVKGARIFLIGLFYKLPQGKVIYAPTIEALLRSFRFETAAAVYKEFTDEARGIFFRYPADWSLDDNPESIALKKGDNPLGEKGGAGIALGVFDLEDQTVQNLTEEEIVKQLKAKLPPGTQLLTSGSVILSGDNWWRWELGLEGAKMTMLVKIGKQHFFIIGTVVKPAVLEQEYREVFDEFQGSLSLDTVKWAAHLRSRQKPSE